MLTRRDAGLVMNRIYRNFSYHGNLNSEHENMEGERYYGKLLQELHLRIVYFT